MSWSWEKTPEELEEERKKREQFYPQAPLTPQQMEEASNRPEVPSAKSVLSNMAQSIIPENSPVGKSLFPKYDIPPELLAHADAIFPSLKSIRGEGPLTPEQLAQMTTLEQVATDTSKIKSTVKEPTKSSQKSSAKSEKPQTSDLEKELIQQVKSGQGTTQIDQMIKDMREQEAVAGRAKGLAKLRDAVIGAGFGKQFGGDYSTYEDMTKEAKKPLEDLTLKNQLENEQAKHDPTSALSKMTRSSLSQLNMDMTGLDNVSYAQLEKLYPSLTQALYVKLKTEADKEDSKTKRMIAGMAANAQKSASEEKALSKHIDFSMNSLKKPYETYAKTQNQIELMSNILGSAANKITPGIQDVTRLFSFVKSLDPDSVVRESEIGLSKSAMSLWGKIKSGTANLTGGDLLDNNTRQSMEEIMKAIASAQEKSFARAKKSVIDAGVGKGLDRDTLNNSVFPEIDINQIGKKKKSPEEMLSDLDQQMKSHQARIDELRKQKGQ